MPVLNLRNSRVLLLNDNELCFHTLLSLEPRHSNTSTDKGGRRGDGDDSETGKQGHSLPGLVFVCPGVRVRVRGDSGWLQASSPTHGQAKIYNQPLHSCILFQGTSFSKFMSQRGLLTSRV